MMKKRLIALLLTLCLLSGVTPINALMEEEDIFAEPIEAFVEEVVGETGADGLMAAGPDDALTAYEVEPIVDEPEGDADESSVDEIGIFESLAAVDTERSAYFSPAFTTGYVSVLSEDSRLADASEAWTGGGLPLNAVLYAYDRNLDDQLAVCFDTPAGVVTGWLDANAIRPMADAEVAAFMESQRGLGNVNYFDLDGTLPLMRVGEAETPAEAQQPIEDEIAETPEQDSAEVQPSAQTEELPSEQIGEQPQEPASEDAEGHSGGPVYAPAEDVVGTADGEGRDEDAPDAPDADDPQAEIPPEAPQYEIALDREALELRVDESAALKVAEIAEDAGGVTWSVDDDTVASVDDGGNVRALSVGETRVVATAENGDVGACALTVKKAPEKIHFSISALTLGVKESSAALKLVLDDEDEPYRGAVRYSTSKKKYVTVSADGTVRGIRKGSATIKAVLANGLTATCKVTVKKAPTKIAANPKSITIGVGETAKPGWSLSKGTAGSVTIRSLNESKVAIEGGYVRGVEVGSARVLLQTYNGKKAYVTVNVREAPESVEFSSGDDIVIGVGQSIVLKAAVNAGAASRLTFASGDPDVASVSGSALIGRAVGETTVTVQTYNGKTNATERRVIVKPAPAYVRLDYTTLRLGVGNSWKLEPDMGDAAGTVTYSSNKKKVAKVSADGTVKGLKAGSAKITIKTYNNKRFVLKVTVKKAPKKVTASPTSKNLGVGERFRLGYSLPSGTQGTVTFAPQDSEQTVLDIDEKTGDIVALEEGEARVVVRTYNGKTSSCLVRVFPAPEDISIDNGYAELGVGQTYMIAHTLSPSNSCSAITYTSSDNAVATVSAAGVITAKGRGEATITASTFVPGVKAEMTVRVFAAPSSVSLDASAMTVNITESFTLVPTIPEDSRTSFSFRSSNAKIASISAEGVVNALQRGTVTLTVTTHNGKRAAMSLTVYDPFYPERITRTEEVPVLDLGTSYQVKYEVTPATARESVRWESANPNAARVDSSGLITAVGFGYSTISAISTKNSAVKMSFVVAVQTEDYTLVIPARTTDTSGISTNRRKINAIKQSALTEIDRLQAGGVISSSDASRRRQIVNNVFLSYDFPWMTPQKQLYWKAKNSEKGAKDFKPGRVYYGMPYISGSGLNRAYTAAAAVSSGSYVWQSGGYYKLNKSNYNSRSYKGNDCSGLCDTAIWGMGNGAKSTYRTKDIAVKSTYKTISDKSKMRPGDLICKSSAHVVMFLYYANAEKTKIMIIENGGSEAGTNTVHCSVMNLSAYSKYKVRRLKSLG